MPPSRYMTSVRGIQCFRCFLYFRLSSCDKSAVGSSNVPRLEWPIAPALTQCAAEDLLTL